MKSYFAHIKGPKDTIGGAIVREKDIKELSETLKEKALKIDKLEIISEELFDYIQNFNKLLLENKTNKQKTTMGNETNILQ